jgi:hypothetical protein
MRKKDKGLITPDDPEFKESMQMAPELFKKYLGDNESIETLKALSGDQDSVKVEFQQKGYPNFHLECGIQVLSQKWSKIIFHFSKITNWDMETLSEYMARRILEMNAPIEVEFSRNPMFRNHWDIIIYTTQFEAPFILDRILVLIDHYPKYRDNAKSRSI